MKYSITFCLFFSGESAMNAPPNTSENIQKKPSMVSNYIANRRKALNEYRSELFFTRSGYRQSGSLIANTNSQEQTFLPATRATPAPIPIAPLTAVISLSSSSKSPGTTGA